MNTLRKPVEKITPPLLIFGMQKRMVGLGYPQTPGIMHTFATASRDGVMEVPVMEQNIVQFASRDLCIDMVKGVSPRDPRDLLLATLAFTLVLAENGLHGALTDPLPQLCRQEIQDFSALGHWVIHDTWVQETALQMLMRARLLGYYIREQ